MKFLKLFAVLLLIMPLHLSAVEQSKDQNEGNVLSSNEEVKEVSNEEIEQDKEAQPTEEKKELEKPALENNNVKDNELSSPVNPNLNPNLIQQESLPKKSLKNSVEGSKEFIQNMLDLIYVELPKKNNNQEVFNYLSLVTTEYFAFTYMSKWAIGREVIKEVPSDLQERYLASSKEFMILLYGEIFNTYYKQYNYRLGEVERKSDTQYDIKMRVESKVQDQRNQDAILDVVWRVKFSEKDKKFYVINVNVNKIVFLSTQKKQFTDMLKSTNNDFYKFIDLLDFKNTETKKRLGINF